MAVISLGGASGAAARYALNEAFPSPGGQLPWTTFGINVIGCFLIGVLTARMTGRFVRAFLGTGILGGFTTFSTYAVDVVQLLDRGAITVAFCYLGLTVVLALAAAQLGNLLGSIPLRRQRGRK